jgi:Cu-Zn family superoxide dismutase
MCRWLTVAIAGTVLALTPVATPSQGAVAPASYGRSVAVSLIGSGTFTLPDPTSKAITYHTALVPPDAVILTSMEPSGWDYS